MSSAVLSDKSVVDRTSVDDVRITATIVQSGEKKIRTKKKIFFHSHQMLYKKQNNRSVCVLSSLHGAAPHTPDRVLSVSFLLFLLLYTNISRHNCPRSSMYAVCVRIKRPNTADMTANICQILKCPTGRTHFYHLNLKQLPKHYLTNKSLSVEHRPESHESRESSSSLRPNQVEARCAADAVRR